MEKMEEDSVIDDFKPEDFGDLESKLRGVMKERLMVFISAAPLFALTPEHADRRGERFLGRAHLLPGLWVSVASPNPDTPGRSHVHILLEDSELPDDLAGVGRQDDVFGRSEVSVHIKPAAPRHARYLLRHLRNRDSVFNCSHKMGALLR
jgi:hypothetical protein